MSRKSWYSRLFGGLFRGRSAAPEKKSGGTALLDVLKAQREARRVADRYRAENPYALPSTVQPVADTPINGTDETMYDVPSSPSQPSPDEPEWETVAGSSNIAAFCYWDASGKLEVKFHDGSHYGYEGVGRDVIREFRQAGSKGRFLKSRIEQVYWYYEITGKPRRYRKYPEEYLGPLNTNRGWGGYRRR